MLFWLILLFLLVVLFVLGVLTLFIVLALLILSVLKKFSYFVCIRETFLFFLGGSCDGLVTPEILSCIIRPLTGVYCK